ncbi:MAG: DUF5067 domain-containing protein [Ruminococcaceae bacterium]|nr:DUF5067 domain-containing protein [Oscillospiraceae bacterium]
MKKIIYLCLTFAFILTTFVGCMNDAKEEMSSMMSDVKSDMGSSSNESATKNETTDKTLGEYEVNIKSCRLAEDYEGKNIVIVNYNFKNNSDDSTSFTIAIDDKVYQDGVGLNKCYTAAESAKYSSDNQSKNIKKGASVEVEVAYYLNDNETPIEVECSELISLSDDKITKNFNIK